MSRFTNLPMWLKATKREFRFELGVRPAAEVGDDDGSSDPPLNPTAEEDSKPVQRMALGSLDDSKSDKHNSTCIRWSIHGNVDVILMFPGRGKGIQKGHETNLKQF